VLPVRPTPARTDRQHRRTKSNDIPIRDLVSGRRRGPTDRGDDILSLGARCVLAPAVRNGTEPCRSVVRSGYGGELICRTATPFGLP
jgi:hypothetical protein